MAVEAFYLPAADGRRFCLLQRPDTGRAWRGAVLHVHPFAEEMNKSRRMAALQARALADAGYGVLQVDLHGCGDSSGDFGDAGWSGWIEDLWLAARWLRERSDADFWWWGLRTGALLACAAARTLDEPARLLFWQPVVSGKTFVQQFLRLKLAAELAGEQDGGGKALMARLRAQLAQGQSVEVAGYRMSPQLAAGLESADLAPPERVARCAWIELAARPDAGLSPAASARLAAWRSAAGNAEAVRAQTVCGPAFWQTAEISECPALILASLDALAGTTA